MTRLGTTGSTSGFNAIDAHPRPTQNWVPVVGGHGVAAHRRAVRHGDGWYGFLLDREATVHQVDSLRGEAERAGRALDDITITVSPREPLDQEVVRDYANLGVHRLVLVPPGRFWQNGFPLANLEDFVRANAPARVGAGVAR